MKAAGSLLLVLPLLGCSYVSVLDPAPDPSLVPRDRRLSSIAVHGFPWTETELTGKRVGHSTLSGGVHYFGFNYGYQGFDRFHGSGTTTTYDYRTKESDFLREAVKNFLEETGAAGRIKVGGRGTLVLQGQSHGVKPSSANTWVTIFYDVPVWATMMFMFTPAWAWYEAEASVRVYDGEGNFLRVYRGDGCAKWVTDWWTWDFVGPPRAEAQNAALVAAYRHALVQFINDVASGTFHDHAPR